MADLEPYTTWFHFPSQAAATLAVDELEAGGYLATATPPRTHWTVGGLALGPPSTFATEKAALASVADAERDGNRVWLVEPDEDEHWLVEAARPRDWDAEPEDWWAPFQTLAKRFCATNYGGETGWLDPTTGHYVGYDALGGLA